MGGGRVREREREECDDSECVGDVVTTQSTAHGLLLFSLS